MMINPTVTTNIDEDVQESSHQNATLQQFGQDRAISIAVHLPDGASDGVDPDDEEAVRALISGMFASVISAGCTVEVQVGRSRDAVEEAGIELDRDFGGRD